MRGKRSVLQRIREIADHRHGLGCPNPEWLRFMVVTNAAPDESTKAVVPAIDHAPHFMTIFEESIGLVDPDGRLVFLD